MGSYAAPITVVGDAACHGEGGIRTLDGGLYPHNALAGRRLQPLGHFSRKTNSSRGFLRLANDGYGPLSRKATTSAICCVVSVCPNVVGIVCANPGGTYFAGGWMIASVTKSSSGWPALFA